MFGGGKVIREGMGQQAGVGANQALDVVITNALVLDHSGVFKADIGIKGGRIVGLGKAGNPDVMPEVTQGMVIGVNTDVIAAEGLIVTAGKRERPVWWRYYAPRGIRKARAADIYY
jgi:urease alpha subunit